MVGSVNTWAQWGWTDNTGKKVFSDMPPPSDVPDQRVFSRPAGSRRPTTAPVTADAAGSQGVAATPVGPGSTPDKAAAELEAKKKQAEDAQRAKEEAKAKADVAQQAKARAENCQRARSGMATLDTGAPLRQMNDKGERVFMDEAQRSAEKRRLQAIVQSDCSR
jgi:hypothetical protein